jgi:hypothetical protein
LNFPYLCSVVGLISSYVLIMAQVPWGHVNNEYLLTYLMCCTWNSNLGMWTSNIYFI